MATDPSHLLDQGISLSRLGHHAESLTAFDRVLAINPGHHDALNNRGVALMALQRTAEAITSFRKALQVRPDFPEGARNLGNALARIGENEQALACYEQALALTPDYADAWSDRGDVLVRLVRHEDAVASYARALQANPGHPGVLNNCGVALLTLRRPLEALAYFGKALAAKPDFFDAGRNAGIALNHLDRFDEAIASFDRALQIKPDFCEALTDRGHALWNLMRYEEALECLDRAVALDPGFVDAWVNRGAVLIELRRYGEAMGCVDRALALDSAATGAMDIRIAILKRLNREDEALSIVDAELARKPTDPRVLRNRGGVLVALGRLDEALADYDQALKINPDSPQVQFDEACALLRIGDFRNGLRKFEWWRHAKQGYKQRDFARPLWMGKTDLHGKSILLYSEQGLGDVIQCLRYVPMVAAAGASVVLEVPETLAPLMSGLAGVGQLLRQGQAPPATDFHCPLLSLPLAFETDLSSIPAQTPYLTVPAERLARWKGRLPASPSLRVGLVWSGNAAHKNDSQRSMTFRQLLPLLSQPAVEYVCLQKNMRPEDVATARDSGMIDISAELDDFADTAAAIAQLDLVITVDTSVAHLAGALGKPVWILLPFSPDWRWLLNREDSPWYPSARLFRQSRSGDWGPVVERMAEELARLAAPRCPKHGKQWKELGSKLIAGRRFAAAALAFEKVLESDPADSETCNELGRAMHALGRLPEAETLCRRTLMLNKEDVSACGALANVLKDMKRSVEAELLYRRVADLSPQDPEAHNNLGIVLGELGRLADAEACFRRVLQLNPGHGHGLSNLCTTLRLRSKLPDAERVCRDVLQRQPDNGAAYYNLGAVLRDLGQIEAAEASLLRALEIQPEAVNALNVLGVLYHDIGFASKAESCYRRALDASPGNCDVLSNLANVLAESGRPKAAEEGYRKAVSIRPDYAPAYSNLLFHLSYFGVHSADQYLIEARGWEKSIVPAQIRDEAKRRTFARDPRIGRKLRVGYISGDFRIHAVSCFIEHFLALHDKTKFEIHAYTTTGVRDAVTERLQRSVDHWHDVSGLTDEESAALVANHQIDVLVDLSGHTAGNRLGVFARRAAPVQCHYVGYFASTGLSEMDYFIADGALIPEGEDHAYCETVWRLPRIWANYGAPEAGPEIYWQPDAAGRICLGSFNHLGKINAQTVALWARLLQRTANAYLLLKTNELNDPENQKRMVAAFAAHGISPSRIELQGRTPDWTSHMALYNRVDVALDPVGGHGGATTTCDALWMGVPVVTLVGRGYGTRMGFSILRSIGREDWAATEEEGYLENVAKIVASPLFRMQLRQTQREAMRRSELLDAADMARTLEAAFTAMFDRWSARQK